MLAAFVARPIVELKQRDKSKIESILAFGQLAMGAPPSDSAKIPHR